jgi:general stress protein 26
MHPSERSEAEQRATLRGIITSARVAVLVTRSSTGDLHGRPMATADVAEDIGRLWFATERNSAKVHELQADNRVFLGYTNHSGSEWATINGTARVIDDRQKAHDLWSPFWRNWFDGPDDPNLILIEVTPHFAEYWDSGSRIVSMVKFAVAALTGRHLDEGENARVDLGARHHTT